MVKYVIMWKTGLLKQERHLGIRGGLIIFLINYGLKMTILSNQLKVKYLRINIWKHHQGFNLKWLMDSVAPNEKKINTIELNWDNNHYFQNIELAMPLKICLELFLLGLQNKIYGVLKKQCLNNLIKKLLTDF